MPKTKIGTEVAHITRDSDTTFGFKDKRSKINFHGAGAYFGGLPHRLFSSNARGVQDVDELRWS